METPSKADGGRYFDKGIENMLFEKTGLNYLAFDDDDGNPSLIKFDFENETMLHDSLPGYMTRFGGIHCLFVKEFGQYNYPMIVIDVRGKQKSDPDMGYSLFIQNGESEERWSAYNFKNEFFQSWTPRKFTFSDIDEDGYVQINIYTSDDILLTKSTVPSNFSLTRKKEEKVEVPVG